MKPTPSPDAIAQYLRDNPEFFEQHQDLLAQVQMPHPHGGRTISLTERQVLTLRDKNRALESKLSELIRFGEENDAIGERVHRLSIALIKAPEWPTVARIVKRHIIEDFEVPHVGLRIWAISGEGEEFSTIDAATRNAIAALTHPLCGPVDGHPSVQWLGEGASHIRSMVEIPLRRGADVIGAIALGSEDPKRFYAGMGTLFLSQIGNLVAAAAARTLGA